MVYVPQISEFYHIFKQQTMPITQLKETIIQDLSIFSSNSFTHKVYAKNRALSKLKSIQTDIFFYSRQPQQQKLRKRTIVLVKSQGEQ